MPNQVIYGEEHPGLRWQLVTLIILIWAAPIGAGVAASRPHLGGFAALAVIGGFFALFSIPYLSTTMAVGFCVYEDSIQIGGLHGRGRELQSGIWPPDKFNVGKRRKAVFICPWQAADGLFLLTEKSDIERFLREARQYRRATRCGRGSTPRFKIPLGVFSETTAFADAVLVISNDPRHTKSEPREFDDLCGRNFIAYPVRSPAWMVPIRDPAAFRAAVERLPQAPPVYDRLPEGHVRFEVS